MPLPRATFSLPKDIQAFLQRIKRENKRRSLQDSFEDCMRLGMAERLPARVSEPRKK